MEIGLNGTHMSDFAIRTFMEPLKETQLKCGANFRKPGDSGKRLCLQVKWKEMKMKGEELWGNTSLAEIYRQKTGRQPQEREK